MTTFAIVKLFAEVALILLGAYAIYREKDIARFERKALKYIKAFFKAVYYTVLEKKQSKVKKVSRPTYRNAEYDEMLSFVYELKDGGYLNPNLGESNYDIVAENNWKPGYRTGNTGRLGNPMYFTTYIMGTMNAISSTSENPARVMEFLELLRTDSDIHNTIQYGIEGEHYILDDNNTNRIAEFIGSGYNNAQFGWGLGSEFISYLQPNQPDDLWEQVKSINAQTEMTPLIGFQFDPTPVRQKIADCRAVASEYMTALQQGQYKDKDAALAEFREKLKKAGCDDVIAEKQRQLDAFLNNK
jgi:putative aldouronate transport system substrate-binding protein